MSNINIRVGGIEFSGEGDPDWLSNQLDHNYFIGTLRK